MRDVRAHPRRSCTRLRSEARARMRRELMRSSGEQSRPPCDLSATHCNMWPRACSNLTLLARILCAPCTCQSAPRVNALKKPRGYSTIAMEMLGDQAGHYIVPFVHNFAHIRFPTATRWPSRKVRMKEPDAVFYCSLLMIRTTSHALLAHVAKEFAAPLQALHLQRVHLPGKWRTGSCAVAFLRTVLRSDQ